MDRCLSTQPWWQRVFSGSRLRVRTLILLVALLAVTLSWRTELKCWINAVLYYPWYQENDAPSSGDTHLRTFYLHAFSSDGKTLATLGQIGEPKVNVLSLWDVSTGSLKSEVQPDQENIRHLLFSANGSTIATVSVGEEFSLRGTPPAIPATAVRWDARTLQKLSTTTISTTPLWSASLSSDGAQLVTGSGDFHDRRKGEITVWDLPSGRIVRSKAFESHCNTAVALAPDGMTIAAAIGPTRQSSEHSSPLMVFDSRSFETKHAVSNQRDPELICFSGDGSTLATADANGVISIYDTTSWKRRSVVRTSPWLNSLALSWDGRTVAGLRNFELRLWDTETGTRTGLVSLHWAPEERTSIALSSTNQLALPSWGDDASPWVIDLRTGEAVGPDHQRPAAAIKWDWRVAATALTLAATFVVAIRSQRRSLVQGRVLERRRPWLMVSLAAFAMAGGGGIIAWRTGQANRVQAAIDSMPGVDSADKSLLETVVARSVHSPGEARFVENLKLQIRTDGTVCSPFGLFPGYQAVYSAGTSERRVAVFAKCGDVGFGPYWSYFIAIFDSRERLIASREFTSTMVIDQPTLETTDRVEPAIVISSRGQLGDVSYHRFALHENSISEVHLKETVSPPSYAAAVALERHGGDVILNFSSGHDVKFSDQRFNDRTLATLAKPLKEVGGVATLCLSGTGITSESLKVLAGLTSLQNLDLSSTMIDDSGLNHLAGLVNLKSLDLSSTRVEGRGLARLRRCGQLAQLNLAYSRLSDAGLEGVRELTALQDLNLTGNAIGNQAVRHISGLTSLATLTLSNTNIDDSGLRSLEGLRNLRWLSLQQLRVHRAGLEELKNLPLEYLDLGLSGLTDKDAESLVHFRTLKFIHLAGTKLSAETIARIRDMPNLQILDVR